MKGIDSAVYKTSTSVLCVLAHTDSAIEQYTEGIASFYIVTLQI